MKNELENGSLRRPKIIFLGEQLTHLQTIAYINPGFHRR